MTHVPRVRADRILVCGLLVPSCSVGGFQLALADVGRGLGALGWKVDLAMTPESLGLSLDSRASRDLSSWASPRWSWVPKVRFLKGDARRLVQHLALDGGAARVHSLAMKRIDTLLHERHYGAVLAVVGNMIPGFAHFITHAHPNVVLVSLGGLANELRLRRWLRAARLSGAVRRASLHPSAYRPVDPARIRAAIFGSESWKDEAVRAGLAHGRAQSIYFGIKACPPLEPSAPVRNRLLWVGRASHEKGLHHFIEALPALRRSAPVTLTAVCGQGPPTYRRKILRSIEALGLGDVVTLLPPVAHSDLPALYRSHDALLFDSPFSEPVALVVLEAFAHGLPVVARHPRRIGPLLVPGSTCTSFRTSNPRDVEEAVLQLLRDDGLRERTRTAAHDVVRSRFTIDTTVRAYDRALHQAMRRDA